MTESGLDRDREYFKALLKDYENLASVMEDESLVADATALWHESTKYIHTLVEIPRQDLIFEENVLDLPTPRPAELLRAQQSLLEARQFVDSCLMEIDAAVSRAARVQDYLEQETAANRARDVFLHEEYRHNMMRDVQEQEAEVARLSLERSEAARSLSGKELLKRLRAIDTQLVRLTALLETAPSAVAADAVIRGLMTETGGYLARLKEIVRRVSKLRSKLAWRQRVRAGWRWVAIVSAAVGIFLLGKAADLLTTPLALTCAATLWSFDEFALKPWLRGRLKKQEWVGLIDELLEVRRARLDCRRLQASYNQDFCKVGLDPIILVAPMAASAEGAS